MTLTVCALAVVLGLASSAGAVDLPPEEVEQSKAAETPDGKDAASAPRPPDAPPEGWHRDRFALKKGKSRLELTGYLQEDFRHFNWQVSGDPAEKKQAKERELRRFRFGSKAQLGRVLLEFIVEPRSLPTGSHLKSLSAAYAFSKGLSLRAGSFKLPGSKEFNVLTNNTDFVDRSMIATRLVPERDWGLSASGVLGRVDYTLGVFKGDGNTSSRRTGTSGVGRVSLEIAKGLQLSGSFFDGQVTATPVGGGVAPSPKGASGQTATGFAFSNRPYVNGARRRLSGGLSYTRGSFRFLGEYQEEREGRRGQGSTGQDLPDALGRGFSAQAAYLLTGERKGVLVVPRRSIFQGGAGAIELVARVETLNFDDAGDPLAPPGFGSRAGNIMPSGASAVEAGVNYWASNFMKVQTTAMWEKYTDPLVAPVPGDRGRYFSLLARVQFMIP